MESKKKSNKIRSNLVKTKKLHKSFIKDIGSIIKKEKIPCLVMGVVIKKDGTPNFLEIIIKRPQRYEHPNIIKKFPKTYKGTRVKVI